MLLLKGIFKGAQHGQLLSVGRLWPSSHLPRSPLGLLPLKEQSKNTAECTKKRLSAPDDVCTLKPIAPVGLGRGWSIRREPLQHLEKRHSFRFAHGSYPCFLWHGMQI
jgi:hypothetical protein